MSTRTKREKPGFVYRDGKLVSVILDIREYEELLERLEDVEGLKYIEEIRIRGPKFRSLDEFLNGGRPA